MSQKRAKKQKQKETQNKNTSKKHLEVLYYVIKNDEMILKKFSCRKKQGAEQ